MKKLFALVATASLMFSCSQEVTPDLEKLPINISVGQQTRANDSTYESGDEVGIYVVNYVGSTAGSLSATGNQVDNMHFTYSNNAWAPDETIYWKDKTTAADFYAYYPYSESPNISAHPFAVATDQSVDGDFWDSDFLWGKTANVSPTSSAVPIVTNHSLSRILVDVVPGNGFAGAWGNAAVSVKICDVKTSATIDLATGVATATGEKGEIAPLAAAETGTTLSYKAMMIPQVVADNSKLVVVTVDGVDYVYRNGYEFKANTEHKFTVTVNKTGGSVEMSIGEWKIDSTTNEGDAEEESESESSIPNNQIWYTATSKITPKKDYGFGATIVSNIWDESTNKGVIEFDGDVTDIGSEAFKGRSNLESITLPESVTYIGKMSFEECTNLKSINIPESVTRIADEAFYDCGLERVDITNIASWCKISFGDIASPLTCGASLYLNGELLTDLVIPYGITSIKYDSFYNCTSLKSIDIPNSVTTIGKSAFCKCTGLESVVIPEGVSIIEDEAFFLCNNLVSVIIPQSVTSIGYRAFNCGSKLSYIYCKPILPPAVEIDGDGNWRGFADTHITSTSLNFKLYVPIGSGNIYKTTDHWKDYVSIIEEKEM